ncbi:ABC transporter substrate-binding protein [Acidobacteria bacterium AH-259-D05]|nr:ABC transporter substrate-binding protein [Acidobacteria bacterium AH-259-D05]
MKKLGLICLLLWLAGCGGSEQRGPTVLRNPDTYTYVTIGDVNSLDPAWSYDTASHLVIVNVYESLLGYRGSSREELKPVIASQVPSRANGLISQDGLTYTFPIRQGVTFQNGTPLTPEDVKYSLMRFLLQERSGGPSSLLLEPILGYSVTRDESGTIMEKAFRGADERIQIEGDKVVIHLPKPYAPLLTILASWAPAVSKQWAIKHGDWDGTEATWEKYNNPQKESSYFFEHMNGTGPFMLERWDQRNKEIILVRNENYWQEPAKLKRVIIKVVNEFATRRLMLSAGDADTINVEYSQLSQLQGLPGVDIIDDLPTIEMNPVAFFTFHVNPAGNPNIGSGKLDGEGIPPDFFSDTDVRKGFAYAMDYEAFIRDVRHGKGTQATGCIPKTLPGHDPNAPQYSHDLKKAEEHFKKAWGGKVWEKGFQFTLIYNEGNTSRQTLCQILKVNVEKLNPKFKIDIRGLQWSTFLDSTEKKMLPMFILGWVADFPDAHNFVFPFLHSQGNYPHQQGYRNPEIDRLIEKAISETDMKVRKALYSQILALAHQDVPHLVVLDTVELRAQRSWVKGWYHNPVIPESAWAGDFYPIYKEVAGR